MVKKLMKHELYALFRVLVFFMAAVLIFAIFGRVMLHVSIASAEQDATSSSQILLTVLLVFFYIIAIMALVVAAWVLGVKRFYRTLFTGEGYMTLSLPATPVQLMISKLLSAIIAMAAAAVVSILSIVVFLIGWDAAVMQLIGEIFGSLADLLGSLIEMEPLLFIELGLLMIVSIPMTMLIAYAVLSLGQLATSRRTLVTALIAFGVYIVANMFSSVIVSPLNFELLYGYGSTLASIHLLLWIHILAYVIVDVGCFFLVRYILKNKVNLIA